MYILKNAFRCIGRAKGRNVLIGIIVLAISISACVGLSIRRAAGNAKEETIKNMTVTATISFDRRSAMEDMAPPEGNPQEGGFDRGSFAQMMGESSALSLEEYQKYAKASTVKDYYYTATVSVNGNDDLEPVSNEEESDSSFTQSEGMPGNPFGGGGRDFIRGAQSDFSLIGVSGENAMVDFISGNASVVEGEIFSAENQENECIISSELATYNDISVGDKIKVINPNSEEEIYTLKVAGLFEDTTANENSFSMMGMTSNDPANKIYISYGSLSEIVTASEKNNQTVTDEDSGREHETKLTESLSVTYCFADVEAYNTFQDEVRELGLEEDYTVSSTDVAEFESSMEPLNTLSKTAGYFLIVILSIGAVILVVLNIFSVRERKYEIGVLTAMGMKKGKVAMQFLTEIFVVTMCAVIVGAGIGAVASVPVANTLLKSQVEAAQAQSESTEQSFGRGNKGGMPQGGNMEPPNMGGGNFKDRFESLKGKTADYVDEISATVDMTVMLQLIAIAIVLTVIAGAFSVLFIMRYEPLKILSNRD